MKKEFGHIYLSWRRGSGHRRHIIGVLKRNSTKGISFQYLEDAIEKAKEEGFSAYTEFPDLTKTYTNNVLDIFGARLTKPERSDINDFYNFWEISAHQKEDKFCLLAHTQGFLPTDNFELLADYQPVSNLKFLTDLAGVTHLQLKPESLSVGDELRFEYEFNNPKDSKAIKIFKGDMAIGYIKKIHANVFHKPGGENLRLKVKAIDRNGIIKRVFVKVSF